MKCTDCHNPHGTLNVAQLRKVNLRPALLATPKNAGPMFTNIRRCEWKGVPHAIARTEPWNLICYCDLRAASFVYNAMLIPTRPTYPTDA